VLSVFATGQALAVPAACDNIYSTANGTASYPGTFVGTVGNTGSGDICQIGKGYSNQDPTKIGGTAGNTIIYSFYYAGGTLNIEQWVGNNGIFNSSTNWNAYFVSLAGANSTSPGSLLGSLDVPFSSGPSFAGTLFNGILGAGYYAIKNSVGSTYTDPQFQINFASSATTQVPEPDTIWLLGAGLLGFGLMRRRRNA
jgi:hypothetical protein